MRSSPSHLLLAAMLGAVLCAGLESAAQAQTAMPTSPVRYYGWQSGQQPTPNSSAGDRFVPLQPAASSGDRPDRAIAPTPDPTSDPVSGSAVARTSDRAIAPTPDPTSDPTVASGVPQAPRAVINTVQVRYFDRNGAPTSGQTQPYIFTRELALKSGDVYSATLAAQGLQRIQNLDIVRRASLTLEPVNNNRVTLVINVVERGSFTTTPGMVTPAPSALRGPFEASVVGARPDRPDGRATAAGSLQLRNFRGQHQNLALRVRGGESVADAELSFTDPWIHGDPQRTGYSVNLFNQRSVQGAFVGGERDVNLITGSSPIVHRMGGGVQVFRPLAPDFTAALGISYQRVSIRDAIFSSFPQPVDARGDRLTVSNSGQDDLLTLNLAGNLDRRNDPHNPTQGSRLQVGFEQTIPVGDAQILFSRLSANYSHYVPVDFFGFAPGPRTLVFNLQGGAMVGDVPPYEAFNLGSGSVRGYGNMGVGTGTRFIQATAEYRFPLTNLRIINQPIDLGGTLFFDYASDLGSGADVIGQPAVARQKPGNGYGYGFGLRANTSMGIVRLEFGISDRGDNEVRLNIGDRF